MSLFEPRMEPRCIYCARGDGLGEGKVLCIKHGVVDASYHCRKFRYDPLKRVPPRPAPRVDDGLSGEDFSL